MAERSQVLMRLRGEAHAARAGALAILAAEYGRKIADARARLAGPDLIAALEAIRREHLAAEGAMKRTLSVRERQRRREALHFLRTKRKQKTGSFEHAADKTASAGTQVRWRRPRQRRPRDPGRGPRARR